MIAFDRLAVVLPDSGGAKPISANLEPVAFFCTNGHPCRSRRKAPGQDPMRHWTVLAVIALGKLMGYGHSIVLVHPG